MEIRFHTSGGSIETFSQHDPALAAQILNGVQCSKLFAVDIITIAGDYSVTTLATSRINRVDFITKNFAPWKHPADVLDVFELSEDEFRERSHLDKPARLEQRQTPRRTGDSPVFFVEVEMTGGDRIYLAAKIKVPFEAERRHRLRMLFSAPAVHFRLRQGGHSILNLKNVVQTTFTPGPDVTPIDAWPAHHLSRQPASVCRATVGD